MRRPVGPQPVIPQSLWPELQQLDRRSAPLLEVQKWLADTHGIKVSEATVSRALAKIRAAAPPPPAPVLSALPPDPPPALLPATEEDELVALRAEIRKDLKTDDWKQRHSAANLLVKILAEGRMRRERSPADPPAAQPDPADQDPGPVVPSVIFSSSPTRGEA